MIKMTFTLDEETVRELERAARRQAIPKSRVVREAVHLYAQQLGRLTEEERARLLDTFDEVVARIPRRSRAEVERELEEVRRARRRGGRRSTRAASAGGTGRSVGKTAATRQKDR